LYSKFDLQRGEGGILHAARIVLGLEAYPTMDWYIVSWENDANGTLARFWADHANYSELKTRRTLTNVWEFCRAAPASDGSDNWTVPAPMS